MHDCAKISTASFVFIMFVKTFVFRNDKYICVSTLIRLLIEIKVLCLNHADEFFFRINVAKTQILCKQSFREMNLTLSLHKIFAHVFSINLVNFFVQIIAFCNSNLLFPSFCKTGFKKLLKIFIMTFESIQLLSGPLKPHVIKKKTTQNGPKRYNQNITLNVLKKI